MKKKAAIVIIGLLLVITGGYLVETTDYVKIKVQCVEIAYSSDKYGKITRNHYMKYPDGQIKVESNGYYQEGSYYSRKMPTNRDREGLGIGLMLMGIISIAVITPWVGNKW